MGLRNLPTPQEKPQPGDVVSNGRENFRVVATGLKYLSVVAMDGSNTTGCLKINTVFKVSNAPLAINEVEEEEEE